MLYDIPTMPVTMKDIARDLGISIIAVSKAIRGHEDISEKTRKRVMDRVKELNYTPNVAARSLATGRTYLVGLVVPDLLHTFFAQIAISLSKALLTHGYGLIISTSEENAEREKRILDQLRARRLDALVVASVCDNPATFEQTHKEGTPLVLIDRSFAGLKTNYVGTDDEAIGTLATEHLIDIGCKRIAHLRGPEMSTGSGRLKGYLDTLAKHKMKLLPSYVSVSKTADIQSKQSGHLMMEQLLKLKPFPDGVFAYNDSMAIGAMHAIFEAGLRIPEDIAVIGCGDLHYDTDLRIPLSSIDQQTEKIGKQTARITLLLLKSKTPHRKKTVIIQPQLIVRASTKKQKTATGD